MDEKELFCDAMITDAFFTHQINALKKGDVDVKIEKREGVRFVLIPKSQSRKANTVLRKADNWSLRRKLGLE